MPTWLGWFIFFWVFVLVFLMAVGGYFMFRKFLKVLPQADGKSKLDRQNESIEAARHLWTEESKDFLDRLVEPVPAPFRDIARHSIAATISDVALAERASEVTRDHCIRGYIMATPKRDYKSLVRFLEDAKIDYAPYAHLLNR